MTDIFLLLLGQVEWTKSFISENVIIDNEKGRFVH